MQLDGSPREAAPVPARPRRVRALVLEESASVQHTLLTILRRLGYRDDDVALATTHEEALAWFADAAAAPEIVFAEFLGVHAEDGLDTIHEMLDRAPGLHLVLVTAEPPDAPEVRAALRAGAFAYVEKPVRQEKIRKAIDDAKDSAADIQRI